MKNLVWCLIAFLPKIIFWRSAVFKDLGIAFCLWYDVSKLESVGEFCWSPLGEVTEKKPKMLLNHDLCPLANFCCVTLFSIYHYNIDLIRSYGSRKNLSLLVLSKVNQIFRQTIYNHNFTGCLWVVQFATKYYFELNSIFSKLAKWLQKDKTALQRASWKI